MSRFIPILSFPLLVLLCFNLHANPVSTDENSTRLVVALPKPSSLGGANLDAPTLGRVVRRILSGDEVPELTVVGRAAVLVSFMNVWRVKKPAKDSALAMLDKTLSPIRKELEFDDFPDNGKLRKSFARLRIAFLTVEAHRRITSVEENQPLREIFAHLAVDLITSTFERRLSNANVPGDAQIIAILSKIRAEGNPDSRVVWWHVVERLRHDIEGSVDKTTERTLSDAAALGGVGGLLFGGFAGVISLVTGTTEMMVGRGNDLLELAAFMSTPFVGASLGGASVALFAPQIKRSIRASGNAFVEGCHAALVQ